MDYDIPQLDSAESTSEKTLPEVFSGDGNNRYKKIAYLIIGGLVMLGVGFSVVFFMFLSPRDFTPQSVTVVQGSSIKQIGNVLQEKNIIKSSSLFGLCSRIVARKESVRVGEYSFDSPEPVCRIAYRMSRGIYGSSQIKITIPEGSTNIEIVEIITKKYPTFNSKEFISLAQKNQGQLFPDTYFFFKGFTTEQLLGKLEKTFHEKTDTLFTGVSEDKKKQILTMASILEREANNPDEAKTISGILWKRIEMGMPLQVDATLKYTTGRGSDKLTLDDLQKDGPYNTYTRTGLPPAPIGNPGIAMIVAAMNPEKSAYLYYLHDARGQIYYAKTHDEHVRNKQKYLK